MATKNNYITTELDWAEEQLAAWRAYVDKNPLHLLKDRFDFKETKNGGVIKTTIASIEAQGKFIQDTMKNYLALLEVVDKLRAQEEEKLKTRGNAAIGAQAEDWIKNRTT